MSISFHEDGQPFSRSSGMALRNGKGLPLRALQPLRLPFKSVFCFRKLQWVKTPNLFQERTLIKNRPYLDFGFDLILTGVGVSYFTGQECWDRQLC